MAWGPVAERYGDGDLPPRLLGLVQAGVWHERVVVKGATAEPGQVGVSPSRA